MSWRDLILLPRYFQKHIHIFFGLMLSGRIATKKTRLPGRLLSKEIFLVILDELFSKRLESYLRGYHVIPQP